MSHSNAKFITVEGIEGVGKSTNIQWMAEQLEQKGLSVVLTREPGGTPLGERVRDILLAEFTEKTLPQTELLLLYAARFAHVEQVIKPALAQGKWVICDRFVDATYAYQGAGRGMDFKVIDSLNEWTLGSFRPDHTVILDAPVEIALARIQRNRVLDRFEKEKASFFEKIRQFYLQCAAQNPERYIVIDASKELGQVKQQIAEVICKI
ncbi:dTMP kinase [Candidatus Berkiella aquae]|uniref:Thymidylate kinase n=1 Tax=Candidatus Berkiella aquae TaxID=295108 RepID=A0A0Q9YPY1_9GAMM|nr:dTMP kinase [Candidatus Berkiella aquae]MCS5711771.1 dTMP kinase [Candidatus Berkiella aquae]